MKSVTQGLCARCRKEVASQKKREEGQRKLDQTPIDPESDQYWKEMVEKLNQLFGGFNGIPIRKINKQTLNEFNEIRRDIDALNNRLNEQYIFVLK